MDTQAMTFGGKSTPEDIEAQRARIPDVKPKQVNLISDALKKELKDRRDATNKAIEQM